ISAATRSLMALLRRLERGELLRRRFLLMLGLPLRERLAVDALAGLILCHRLSALFGSLAIPVGEAVATEAGQDHQVDVLHVGARGIQMLQQAAERCGIEFVVGVAHMSFPGSRGHYRANAKIGDFGLPRPTRCTASAGQAIAETAIIARLT